MNIRRLVTFARRAGIAIPPDPSNLRRAAFPHFWTFCELRKIAAREHYADDDFSLRSSAEFVACFTPDELAELE